MQATLEICFKVKMPVDCPSTEFDPHGKAENAIKHRIFENDLDFLLDADDFTVEATEIIDDAQDQFGEYNDTLYQEYREHNLFGKAAN